jgi:phosphoglycerol transferase MdoB-like AlkP superfamily enzyme
LWKHHLCELFRAVRVLRVRMGVICVCVVLLHVLWVRMFLVWVRMLLVVVFLCVVVCVVVMVEVGVVDVLVVFLVVFGMCGGGGVLRWVNAQELLWLLLEVV